MNTDLVEAEQALERGDTAALAARMQALFPHDPRAAEAREFIAAFLSSPAAVAPIGQEQPFLNSTAELIGSRNVLPPGVRPQSLVDRDAPIWHGESAGRNSIVIGQDLDFFGEGGAAWRPGRSPRR